MLDIIRLLRDYQIPFKGATTGNQIKIDCPSCQGSFKVWAVVKPYFDEIKNVDRHPGTAWCHRCHWRPGDEELFVKELTGKRGRKGVLEWKKYQCLPEASEDKSKFAEYIQKQLDSNPWASGRGAGASGGKRAPLVWPEGFVPLTDPRVTLEYRYASNRRGIKHEDIVHHQLGACLEGEYKGYLILPVISRGVLQFWQAREARDRKSRLRYRTPRGYTGNNSLFNLDIASQYDEPILCEGWFSAYRAGYDAMATFGNRISIQQVELLQSRGVHNINVAFDPDSWTVPEPIRRRAPRTKPPLYNALMRCLGRFDSVRVTRLVGGDPDELGSDLSRMYANQAIGISSESDVLRLWI